MDQLANFDTKTHRLTCQGEWILSNIPQLEQSLNNFTWPQAGEVTVDGKQITKMDSAGAWLLSVRLKKSLPSGVKLTFEQFNEQSHGLFSLVEIDNTSAPLLPAKQTSFISRVGKNTIRQWHEFTSYLNFIGSITMEGLRLIKSPSHFRWRELASIIQKTGLQALPIIALLSFMIGVVLAYQMGLQLRAYGANAYIVDLLGLAVLREFAPLITAIMVAGRTGSAFTAQLGIMKINEEVDALNTMGVTPGELLIIPRIIGLFIALPLLTMWADMFGVFGGMVMANNLLNIGTVDFLSRFDQVIPLKSLLIGLGKAPVFALIIASVGCFEGMKVERSADSLGANTTRSVVLGIFFIIVADALFSIIFSKLQL